MFLSDWGHWRKKKKKKNFSQLSNIWKIRNSKKFLDLQNIDKNSPSYWVLKSLLLRKILVYCVVCCTEIFILLNFMFKLPTLLGGSTLEYWKKISNPSFEFTHNGICCIFWKCFSFFFFRLASFIYGLLIQPYRVVLICLSFCSQLQAIKLGMCTVAAFFLLQNTVLSNQDIYCLLWLGLQKFKSASIVNHLQALYKSYAPRSHFSEENTDLRNQGGNFSLIFQELIKKVPARPLRKICGDDNIFIFLIATVWQTWTAPEPNDLSAKNVINCYLTCMF